MSWVRRNFIGRGSFSTVHLAEPTSSSSEISSPTAVKSSQVFCCSFLKNEKQVLDCLGFCPQIVQCLGDGYSLENGVEYYNLFLEYAAGCNLSDHIKNRGGRLPESDVRRCTMSIVQGIQHIHAKGFVHCDIKLQNILLFGNGDVKIADFGLAKKTGEEEEEQSREEKQREFRGTPLFMSPESVKDNVYDSPADIWSLGCAVVEMVTGKPAWNSPKGSELNNIYSLLLRIGVGDELPEIPDKLSEDGKDFLRKCLVKDPAKRWTAEMLLKHPFIKQSDEESSPRSHFDFPDWVSSPSTFAPNSPESDQWCEWKFDSSSCVASFCSPVDRLRQMVTDERPNWLELESENWEVVR
ncbi:mitogen-activated protein kinase kinase kinase 20 [Prosopis cineraria]|uniref:mitogen-activated protein kinase kinase kinase 20 n=1 Tax=Prosopis cineraria TaxID=364024 RepID=UPI00240FA81C|nr:mitogen-activated protein kinase kinase kinase 20 [Prosopis cineraria]